MPNIHSLVKSAEISIDAATKYTYETNRRGGKWGKLIENLEWIQTLGINTKISMVVQKNNYHEMPEFVKLGEKYGFDIYFAKLIDWHTYADYSERAIHLPQHPDHLKLVKILKNPIFNKPYINLGNLAQIPKFHASNLLV